MLFSTIQKFCPFINTCTQTNIVAVSKYKPVLKAVGDDLFEVKSFWFRVLYTKKKGTRIRKKLIVIAIWLCQCICA